MGEKAMKICHLVHLCGANDLSARRDTHLGAA
jgi:hypothetical protein